MISAGQLTVVMWTVIAAWVVTTVLVMIEFELRVKRKARASGLVDQLRTAGRGPARPLPEVTRSDFQALADAGLPAPVEKALAQQVRSHDGDDLLLTLANGSRPGSIEDRIEALHVVTSGRHPEMYAALAAALRAPEPEVAAMALRLLKELNGEAAVAVLIDALAAGVYLPSRIAAAIDRMTVERASYLGPLLQHESQTVRFWALLLCGRTGASQWAADVRRLVTDQAPQVRRAAVEAMGRLGNPEDQAHVLACLVDPQPMVRVHAARAASAFTVDAMAAGLAGLLSDREWIVRAAARDSLCRMGEVATAAVTRALWEGDPFAANNAAEVLFQTGATATLIDRLLKQPEDVELRRLVERLMTASGPQIARAVYDQLEPDHQTELERILTDALAVVRKRAR
jgi:HEAT repeat protein